MPSTYTHSEGLNGAVKVKRELAYDSPATSIAAEPIGTNPWELQLERNTERVGPHKPDEEFIQVNGFYPSGYAPQLAEEPISSGIQQDTLY